MIKRDYWWPGLNGYVARYIRACPKCQDNKPRHRPLAAPLHPHAAPRYPIQGVSVDLIRPISESDDQNAILVMDMNEKEIEMKDR